MITVSVTDKRTKKLNHVSIIGFVQTGIYRFSTLGKAISFVSGRKGSSGGPCLWQLESSDHIDAGESDSGTWKQDQENLDMKDLRACITR